jgi:hypothetical protein
MKRTRNVLMGMTIVLAGAIGAATSAPVVFAKEKKEKKDTSPDKLMAEYAAAAKKAGSHKEFTAEAGKAFYNLENKNKKGEMTSCATCHTPEPTKTGKTTAGKPIDPVAVSANPDRFTNKAKVEKWFKRNCGDVFQRACTPQEKGDFIAYMKAAK